MISLNDVLLAISNIPVDDPIAEIWGRGLQGGYRIIEYTGSLPITITADGSALIDYCIYGNTVQTGTPAPENPIVPGGVGEKVDITGLSEPLCSIGTYIDSLNLSTGILTRRIKKLVLTGEEGWVRTANEKCYYINLAKGCPADYLKSNKVTIMCSHYKGQRNTKSGSNEVNEGCICFFTGGGFELYIGERTITSAENFKAYLAQQYAAGTPITIWYVLENPEVSTIPVPSGLTGTIEGYLIQDGTPTPETPIYPTANGVKQADDTYSIPYGYKLPITANGVEYPIYLGEAETTRRIKKVVLTGEETSYMVIDASKNIFSIRGVFNQAPELLQVGGFCSHYKYNNAISSLAQNMSNGDFVLNKIADDYSFTIMDNSFSNDTDFKRYVQQQYAAGTPVTVWYVLAEPETGIVNEPLMKIGDYADTLNMEQADVDIPTFVGETVIDYDGDPKPSQMYVKYKGKR